MDRSDGALLICGASLAGLGAACAAQAAGRETVIVERTGYVGREFIEAFRPGRANGLPETEFGASVKNDWVRRNLIGDHGSVHLPGLHPVLCLLIKQRALNVRFLTEIIDVSERDGGYEVLLYDVGGCHSIRVGEVLDTTSERLSTPGQLAVPGRKRLNAYLHHPAIAQIELPAPIDGSMSVVRGLFPSEVIMQFDVPASDDWVQARNRLYTYWEARPEAWSEWTVAAVASVFAVSVPEKPEQIGRRFKWAPSESYGHPLAAIDQGYASYQGTGEKRNAASIGS